jgi:hypothetical protein
MVVDTRRPLPTPPAPAVVVARSASPSLSGPAPASAPTPGPIGIEPVGSALPQNALAPLGPSDQMTVAYANQIAGNPVDALSVFGPLDVDRVARLLAPATV